MNTHKGQNLTFTRKRLLFLKGARDTFPLVIGAAPFGLIYGTLALKSGLSFEAALAMSTFVFAGSAQFIAVGLVAAHISWPFIVITTFIVNLRHALYSATLASPLSRLTKRWKIPLAFWLTDETFAITSQYYEKEGDSEEFRYYYLGSALYMYCNWQLCTVLGLIAGNAIPDAANWGLDAAMPVTFAGIVIPYLKNRPMILCALVSAFTAIMTHSLPNKSGLLLASLAGIIAGTVSKRFAERSASDA